MKYYFIILVTLRIGGDVTKQPVNQRKYRIKKKMREAECEFLFDLIFTNP